MSQEEYLNGDFHTNREEVKSFVKKLCEQENLDTGSIITHYLSYKPETVEAALIISVDKGLITYDLKEKLWNQIAANFASHEKLVRNYKWESNNAFILYVSNRTDDEIYNILEDPNEIMIDVYHALLFTAKERELISDNDFRRYFDDAKHAGKGNEVNMRYDIADLFRNEDVTSDIPDESENEAEKAKFWKCPECGEMVGMEFGVCWNCSAEIPEVIEHPDRQEILTERNLGKKVTPVGVGVRLVGAGVFVIFVDMLFEYHYSTHLITHLGGYFFGGMFIVLGIGFIIYGTFFNREER